MSVSDLDFRNLYLPTEEKGRTGPDAASGGFNR